MGRCPDCQATLIKKYSSAANQAVLEKYTPDDRGSISQLFCELMRTLDRNLEQNERIEDFFEGAFKMAKNNHQYNTAEMLDKFLRMISDEIIQIEYKRKISADQYEKRKIQEGIYAALLQRAEQKINERRSHRNDMMLIQDRTAELNKRCEAKIKEIEEVELQMYQKMLINI